MDTKTAYTLGWVWGLLNKAMPNYDKSGVKFERAAQHPLIGLASIHNEAVKQHKIDSAMAAKISDAIDGIDIEEVEDDATNPIPAELQGSWQIGYWHAQSGKIIDYKYDIKAHRTAAGLTQAQLAEKMEVTQEMVSRWETGAVTPNANNFELLKKILDD